MVQRAPTKMTYAEYLVAETKSDLRHEYFRGDVVAMTGGTPTHAGLIASMTTCLAIALRGKPCRVYSSDLRVRVPETDMATYADITVVCGKLKTAADDANAAINPTLVVEVLSPSTEGYDRGEKAAHYRRIASLKEIVFVSQERAWIEIHRRNARGRWELVAEAGAGTRVKLESIKATVAVDDVYA